jgi:hypothetical protein
VVPLEQPRDPEHVQDLGDLAAVAEPEAQPARPLIDSCDLGRGVAAAGLQRAAEQHEQRQLLLVPLAVFGERLDQGQGGLEVGAGFLIGAEPQCVLAGCVETGYGAADQGGLRVPRAHGLAPVMREEARLGSLRLESLRDLQVQLLAVAAQQGGVRGVLDQRVLEGVPRFPAHTPAVDELGLDQLVQPLLEGCRVERSNGREQVPGKGPADDGGDLGHLLGRTRAVEPGGQGAAERRRDLHELAGPAGLQKGLGQLFDEQGDAIRPGQDLLPHIVRQGLRCH